MKRYLPLIVLALGVLGAGCQNPDVAPKDEKAAEVNQKAAAGSGPKGGVADLSIDR